MSKFFIESGKKTDGQKVMLATPVYSDPDASYTFAIAQSREALHKAGIESAFVLLTGNTHVDDGRNSIVHEFLRSDCTDLIFLDADVSWSADDLVTLCQYGCDIVGGVYPFRVETSTARGMPYRPLEGAEPANGLIEVEGLPTGFMRIRRAVLEAMAAESPSYSSKKDSRTEIPLIFERTLESGTRWGGDLNFCNKYRAAGGRIYAALDFRLGHAFKGIVRDSLGAYLRRREGTSLEYVVDRIRHGVERPEDYTEAYELIGNEWGACDEVLMVSVAAARKANGPIIETGSGLSTVLMAAATSQPVFAIEHDDHYADRLRFMVQSVGLKNVSRIKCNIRNGWYDIDDARRQMPARYGLGLNDGPPHAMGDRMRFLHELGDAVDMIVCDDADNPRYAAELTVWAESKGRNIHFPDFRSAFIEKAA